MSSDEMWIFGEETGTFPRHEEHTIASIGLTDGIIDEIEICLGYEIPISLYHIDAETGDIELIEDEVRSRYKNVQDVLEDIRNGEQ